MLAMFAASVAGMSPAAADPPASAGLALTPQGAREDLELAISAVEAGLPDIHWHQSARQWRRAKNEARSRIEGVADSEMLWRVLRPLMSQIGEGHLSLRVSDAMALHYREAVRFPLDILWTEQGAFVIAAYGPAADIPKGTRLLAIDGRGTAAILDDAVEVIPHDGIIRTGVMRDLSGRGLASTLFRLYGPKDLFHITVDINGKRVERDVVAVPRTARPPEPDGASPLPTLEWLDPSTAYLNVPTFSNTRLKAAGADYREAIHTLFTRLEEGGARNLILDLRENGGGSEPNEAILFSYLVDDPLRRYAYVEARGRHVAARSLTGTRFEREVFDSEEMRGQRRIRRGRLTRRNIPPEGLMSSWTRSSPAFRGRLVVLAGGNTFSGGAELASMLYHVRRAMFVGEEVAGTHEGNTSGYRWAITLPNSGMTLTIPLLKFRMAWPGLPHDRGVRPDCFAPPDVMEAGVRRDHAWRLAVALASEPSPLPSRACPPGVR